MSERPHLSIGEVLSLLQDEFPDITISKIRFLESQGLLDPERTPSGYRKFYEQDLDRLRWILTQQRDHFLPLKIIKDRLDSGFQPEPLPDGAVDSANGTASPADDESAAPVSGDVEVPGDSAAAGVVRGNGTAAAEPAGPVAEDNVTVLSAGPGPGGDRRRASERAASATRATSSRESRFTPQAEPAARAQERLRGAAAWVGRGPGSENDSSAAPPGPAEPERPPVDVSSVSMSLTELAGACGLEVDAVRELERFGLICGQRIGSDVVYGDDALLAAQLAARFRRHGIEARHLRQYRMSADKEMALFEQVVAPLLRAREPGAGSRAIETLGQLGELGDALRKVLVKRAMREYLGGE
jgi:DNA-binding transcriptional MerR regulator